MIYCSHGSTQRTGDVEISSEHKSRIINQLLCEDKIIMTNEIVKDTNKVNINLSTET